MDSDKLKLVWTLLLFAIFLCFISVFAMHKSGEILQVMKGDIKKCEYLGGADSKFLPHATIKTETGRYVTAAVLDCKPRTSVNVFVKRGALYFNTVFVAEKL